MSGTVDDNASESDKPVEIPFPDPGAEDFDEDIEEEERKYYQAKFKDLNEITKFKPHCSACDRHLGCSTRNDTKMRVHPMLRTLVCSTCHSFYNSGEFDKGEDGSELYCRWCGQGGQVYCCSDCPVVFCAKCIRRNFGNPKIKEIENIDDWKCFKCNPRPLWDLRAVCWALLRYVDLKIKITHKTADPELKALYVKDCQIDHSECCKEKKKRTSLVRKEKEAKKPDVKVEGANKTAAKVETPVKLPPSIQVKKFAAINPEEPKKAQKRPASPKNKLTYVSKPITINPRMPMNIANSYSNFPKRPKMDDESLASTSNLSGTPTADEMKLAREWFSDPSHTGKSIGLREKRWIVNVFKAAYQKKLEELNLINSVTDYESNKKKYNAQCECIRTVAEQLNLSHYYVSKILKESGIIIKQAKPIDKTFTKLIPNPYNKERMQFMPIVHSQYMPRKPQPPPPPMSSSPYAPPMMMSRPMQNYNGYPTMTADNINLSLESLTQGLDVNAMLARSAAGRPMDDGGNLVCTPDFPLEPLCEVMEENNDDDVECMTPGPVAPPKVSSGTRRHNRVVDSDNIIQMTENDVTVNAATGGLKFRVDPQTLSANKMYRLPDGRVFAINANPKMPGGYSATIVALADDGKAIPARGTTYSAKVSAIAKPHTPKPQDKRQPGVIKKANAVQEKLARLNNSANNGQNKARKCDLNVPVEWYIYNVTDAIDSLEYTLMRLKKLKKNTNSTFLRTRSVEEIRNLHKNLDRLMANSCTRFSEIRTSLGKGYKSYCQQKALGNSTHSDFDSDDDDGDDDDDDVEIVADNHDEPIFIDENSVDSTSVVADGQVDLVSSDLNESGDKDKSNKTNKSKDKETDLNDKTNDSEDPISTSNLDDVTKSSEMDHLEEKCDKDGDDTEVNTSLDDKSTSKQKEPADAMEINDETDGPLDKNDASEDEAVDTSNESGDKMETSENVIEGEKKDDGNDDEDKIDSVDCDSTNKENNHAGSDADAENSVDKDENDEIKGNKNHGDDKDNSLSDKEDEGKNEGNDNSENDKANENDLLKETQDFEKLDDDDIESLLKGGDELDDLASKVQCIVEMDPDLI